MKHNNGLKIKLHNGEILTASDRKEAVYVAETALGSWMQDRDRIVWSRTGKSEHPDMARVLDGYDEATDAWAIIYTGEHGEPNSIF